VPPKNVDKLPAAAPALPLYPNAPASVHDDFDLGELQPCWVSLRERQVASCTTKKRPGWLSLQARGRSLDEHDVTFVGRRQQHLSCRVRVLVDPPEGRGGLAVCLDEQHHYDIELSSTGVQVLARIGPLKSTVTTRPMPPTPVVLRIDVVEPPAGGHSGPDVVSLGFEEPDGTFAALATLDGRYLSTEVVGGFTGRVIGMYAATGTVHFEWFDYESLDS
jgi:xylan 1,4-beta-xylosidase